MQRGAGRPDVLFADRFPDRPAVLAVVDVVSLDQARRNVTVAYEAGCSGVFLVGGRRHVFDIHDTLAEEFSGFWLGVNCRDLTAAEVFATIGPRVAGVWIGNERIDTEGTYDMVQACRTTGWKGLLFAELAFDWMNESLWAVTRWQTWSLYIDVVTSARPSPDRVPREKGIVLFKAALKTAALGLVGGLTPEKVVHYLDLADGLLVGRGISRSPGELDRERTEEFVRRVRTGKRAKAGRGLSLEWCIHGGNPDAVLVETDSRRDFELFLRAAIEVTGGGTVIPCIQNGSIGEVVLDTPSFGAASYLSSRGVDLGQTTTVEPRQVNFGGYPAYYLLVCSIVRAETKPAAAEVDRLVSAVFDLCQRVDLDRLVLAAGSEGPFDGCEGGVGLGFRMRYCNWSGGPLFIEICHVYHGK